MALVEVREQIGSDSSLADSGFKLPKMQHGHSCPLQKRVYNLCNSLTVLELTL